MTIRRLAALALMAATAAACHSERADAPAQDVDSSVQQVEVKAKESHTISALARLEESLSAYIKHEGRIPKSLDALVPKYLADIPDVELGLRAHRDTNRVTVYPRSVLRDGELDGTRLKDTGGWGYVFSERQVVVFVDCTHRDGAGRAWYLQRGVY